MSEGIHKPIFIISLDTELIWGCLHSSSTESISLLKKDDENVRGCIESLLNLFEKHNIPATWAVIGHLFLDHCECEAGIPHKDMPRFKNGWYSSDPCTDIQRDPLYYGKDIVEQILSNRVEHEIGYHSFSHVNFSECSHEVAEAEIKEGIKIAKEFGITLKSFVFPWNGIAHVDLLKKYGFNVYRGVTPGRWDVNQNILIRKFNGGIDMIIAQPVEPKWMDGIWEMPTSMLFCDPQVKSRILPKAKIGLYQTMRSKKAFHVYLHPHDLLRYSSLKDDLDKFLAFVSMNRDKGKIVVKTMGGVAKVLNDGNEV